MSVAPSITAPFAGFKESIALTLPLFTSGVAAGFPSPADDYLERKLDLNEYLVEHPAATFFARVDGDSMQDAGIHSGDIVVVDRSLTAKDGQIILAVVNGEFTIKRLKKLGIKLQLCPENKNYPILNVTADMDFQVWGVVTSVIKKF